MDQFETKRIMSGTHLITDSDKGTNLINILQFHDRSRILVMRGNQIDTYLQFQAPN
jgi:hypothetical protein